MVTVIDTNVMGQTNVCRPITDIHAHTDAFLTNLRHNTKNNVSCNTSRVGSKVNAMQYRFNTVALGWYFCR